MRNDRSGIRTGILMIALGLLFMGDRQGLLSFRQMWPVILIVMGGAMVLFPGDGGCATDSSPRGIRRRRGRASGGIWMILVGVLFLMNQNHWMSLNQTWPLFIVAGGLAMIFGGLGRGSRGNDAVNSGTSQGQSGNDVPGGGAWQ